MEGFELAEFIKANQDVIENTRRFAELYRNMLAIVGGFYANPEKFTEEQRAGIEKELEQIDPEFLTLPWESERFDLSGTLEKLMEDDNKHQID